MLTHGQSDFYIQYIDPETNALRSYYPDFSCNCIRKMDPLLLWKLRATTSWKILVVLAKADYARQVAVVKRHDLQHSEG